MAWIRNSKLIIEAMEQAFPFWFIPLHNAAG